MARATLRVWREGDAVHARLESRASSHAFEHSVSLLDVLELGTRWRNTDFKTPLSGSMTRDMGREIGAVVLGRDIGQALAALAAPSDGRRFHLGLELEDASVRSLPWEMLNLDGVAGDGFLSLLPRASLSRITAEPRSDSPSPTLRLLLAHANPSSHEFDFLPSLDREVISLRNLLTQHGINARVTRLGDAGPATLRRELGIGRPRDPHGGFEAMHFCGHAGRSAGGGYLVLQGGRSHEILEAAELADWLVEAGVRLVFLSACVTAGRIDAVADTLVAHGVPAAIGFQTPARDEAQAQVATEFYRELVNGASVDEALAAARQARRYDPYWWSPALVSAQGRHILVASPFGAPTDELPRAVLPHFTTAFVGRDAEMDRISRALLSGWDVLTLIGLGGSGKSRLAAELGHRMQRHVDGVGPCFPDGIYMIDCTSIDSAAQLVGEIAAALDLQVGSNSPEEALRLLLGRTRALLILDCVDKLVASGHANLIASLQTESGARIVTTCRRALTTAGEEVIEIGPIKGADDPEHDEGVKLFVSAVNPPRPYDASSLKLVSAICRKLDWIPLAIMIVAGRAKMLPLADVHAYVQSRPVADVEAIVAESIDLLAPSERDLLARLTCFRGSFTIEDAAEVLEIDRFNLAESLLGLIQKSMLSSFETGDSLRYRILDVIRETMERAGGIDISRDRRKFVEVFSNRAITYRNMEKTDRRGANVLFWETLPNIQAAITLAIAADMAEELAVFADAVLLPYLEAGLWPELDELMPVALELSQRHEKHDLAIRVLGIKGALTARRGDRPGCHRIWEDRLAISRRVGNAFGEADSLIDLGCQAVQDKDQATALDLFAQAETALERCDHPELAATVEIMRARLALDRGDTLAAQPHIEAAEAIAEAAPAKDPLLFVYTNVARLYAGSGNSERAVRNYHLVLTYAETARRRYHLFRGAKELAELHFGNRNFAKALPCLLLSICIAGHIFVPEGVEDLRDKINEIEQELSETSDSVLLPELSGLDWTALLKRILRESP